MLNLGERQLLAKTTILVLSHLAVAALGFALGIYALPILMAPAAPSSAEISQIGKSAVYAGEFKRDLTDSDFLHWGEGILSISVDNISLQGQLAPGPAYRLYLSPEFVDTESAFMALKPDMALVGSVDTFENFIVAVPESVDVTKFNTVVIWCESFGQFITAAKYKE